MSIITDGLRSNFWVSFAKNKLQTLKDLGLIAKTLIVNGYKIQLLTLEDIDKIRITAPPGAVAVGSSDGGGVYKYYYVDQYGGDFVALASLPQEESVIAGHVFSANQDLMYHAGSAYSWPDAGWVGFGASWYAPNPAFPAKMSGGGYLTGLFNLDRFGPIRPVVGFAFTRENSLYSIWFSQPNRYNTFADVFIGVTRNGRSTYTGFDFTTIPGFWGVALFARPKWGKRSILVYMLHVNALSGCDTELGAASVTVYEVDISTDPFGVSGGGTIGVIDQDALANAFGFPSPCGDEGSEWDLRTALLTLIGDDWPYSNSPYKNGMFSCNESDVCFWGRAAPSWDIKGLVLSYTGKAVLRDIVLPSYDENTELCVITEVSSGWYSAVVTKVDTDYNIQRVYYGTPFTGWTQLANPGGDIMCHKTIRASAAEGVIALSVSYNSGADATILYEYDGKWEPRGKVGDGRMVVSDVALFGDHKFAQLASMDSPIALVVPGVTVRGSIGIPPPHA